MKVFNKIVAWVLVLINIYFLPMTYQIIISKGGGFGYGLLVLPISFSINLLLITSGLVLLAKRNKIINLLIINSIGLIWSMFWMILFLTD